MSKGQPPMWERIVEQETRGQVHEAEMTDAEMKERERLVKGMKKSADDFETRYPGRGKEVMYATATKRAMEEGESDSDYETYFRAMLKKHGYDSPADIPDDKKDDFFNAVDAGYDAKNESRLAEASSRPVRVGDYVHAGFAVKGGAGFSGRVDKVDGNWVYVNVGKDKSVRFTDDPSSNWGERIIKAPMKNVSLQSESRLAEAPESILKPGAPVKVPHRGKMVSGKVVRYDNGKPYFSPYYIVDVGELSSVLVPAHAIKESRLAEATDTPMFTVVATMEDPTPEWKRRPGSGSQKVVWQMWGLAKKEIPLAAKIVREKHPKATISVENATGTIVKVYKPGQTVTESISLTEEHDDLAMMKGQLMSIIDRSEALLQHLNTNPPANIEAWAQAKATEADHGILAIHDYFNYNADEESPNDAMMEANAMVPLQMQAAVIIAKSLGSVKGSGEISPEVKLSGGSPSTIVNQAIRVWLSGSHTNEGWALGARMLKLAHQMGIKWDTELVKKKLAPITRKKLGLDTIVEAEGTPTNLERVRQQQTQEKEAMERRQEREKIIAQQRDAEEKFRQREVQQAQSVKKA